MKNFPTITRRSVFALGFIAVSSAIGMNSWAPQRIRVYESTTRSPKQRKQDNLPPIVDGEPSLDAPIPTVKALVFQSTEEAERRMDWDALLPPETSKPYRNIGPREFTSVVVAVLPVASELVDTGSHYVQNGTVHHDVSARDRSNELTLSMDENVPIRCYMLNKWTLNFSFNSAPTTAEVRFVPSQ